MKAYSDKFDELIQIMKEEVSANKTPLKAKQGQHFKTDETETFDQILKRLKSSELARGIINLKSVLSTIVIPKLFSFEMDIVSQRLENCLMSINY